MFTQPFDAYVCDGSTITCEVDGFTLTATIHNDVDASAPWERDDGHGPVSEWTTGRPRAGERLLITDRYSHRFYDFAEAVRIARRDGWGNALTIEGETALQKAKRAAECDYAVLKAWCNNEWHYVGVAVTVSKAGVRLTGKYDHALWGIEANYPGSDNSYLAEVARELAEEALDAARAKLAELAT